jgi:translation initiation factor IF-2
LSHRNAGAGVSIDADAPGVPCYDCYNVTCAGPGQAVVVSGLKGVPSAGDELLVVGSEQRAAKMAAARSARAHDYRLSQLARMQAEHTRRQLQMREQEYERCVAW